MGAKHWDTVRNGLQIVKSCPETLQFMFLLIFTFTFIILTIVPSQEKTYPRHCTLDKKY